MKKRLLYTWYHILATLCVFAMMLIIITCPIWFFVWLLTGFNIFMYMFEVGLESSKKIEYLK